MSRRQYSDGDPGPSQPKRLRTSGIDTASEHLWSTDHHWPSQTTQLSNDDYTIAWICALPLELRASLRMFDEVHLPLRTQQGDMNTYALGRVEHHNVVMACLPGGQYGTINAATVAVNLLRSFPRIRATLMVGIGGGAPSDKHDIRLGDIVVGDRVVQYDMGKDVGGETFQRTGRLMYPPHLLSSVLPHLQAAHTDSSWSPRVTHLLRTKLPDHVRPNQPDQLFQASYEHSSDKPVCDDCDLNKLETRLARTSNGSKIHYGGIASANTVMKNARTRDNIARELSICCFEMEAAGIMDKQCLPIRGICDYSDSHKNKAWQAFAAAAAAAYARELLEVLQPEITQPTRTVAILGEPRAANEAQAALLQLQRQKLLSIIYFDTNMDRYREVSRAHSETCEWFLVHPMYQNWLHPQKQQQTHGYLWVVGKAGAGKSTIMKFACSDTEQKRNQLDTTVTPFFFNAQGSVLEKSVAGMYCSLLWHLLTTFTDLQAVLDNEHVISPTQRDCPSVSVLQTLFRNAVMGLGQRTFICFVDALDESNEDDIEQMVSFFDELSEDTTRKRIRFLVCFSSRPYPRIAISQGVRLVLDHEAGHKEDLAIYVKKRLKGASSLVLGDRILEKADGVFMWVVLVVGILNNESKNGALALERKLSTIPATLSELFRNILTRDENDVERLLHSVLWVLCANRPLGPLEFRHALWAIELAHGEVDDVLEENSIESATNLVTSASKGLVEFTASRSPTAQFIHESVRDFLIKENGLREIWRNFKVPWEPHAHEKLKHCCDTYLSLKGVQSAIQRLRRENCHPSRFDDVEGKYPFLKYAGQQVLYHADAAAIEISQLDFIKRFSTPAGIRALNHVETAPEELYTPDAPLLYILAHQGRSTLIGLQVEKTSAVFSREFFIHPLFAAIERGHHQSVAALLRLPISRARDITQRPRDRRSKTTRQLARIQQETWNIRTSYSGRTLLTWAVKDGRWSLAKALIEDGAEVNEKDQFGETALQLALRSSRDDGRQCIDVVWLLIDSGARGFEMNLDLENSPWWFWRFFSQITGPARAHFVVNAEATYLSGSNWTPALVHAAACGNETAARLLIDQGADVNATTRDGRTAFIAALESKHLGTAQLLIDRRADVLICDSYKGKTALMHASAAGFADVVRHLIEKGASVHTEDGSKWTALNYATSTGTEAAARVLIENDAHVDRPDENQKTPLVYASSKGNAAMLRLLIGSGANAGFSSSEGRTTLMEAADHGHEAAARILIAEDTVDVNAQDNRGWTALMRAVNKPLLKSRSEDRALALTRLLIQGGAEVNAQDESGRTALMHASVAGNFATVSVLLNEGGAKVNAQDESGRTALMHASMAGKFATVSVLLNEGGAKVNAQDESGETALMHASVARNAATVSVLLDEGGAEVDVRNNDGWTALMVAADAGNSAAIDRLVTKKADSLVQDNSGRTALALAEAKGYIQAKLSLRRAANLLALKELVIARRKP